MTNAEWEEYCCEMMKGQEAELEIPTTYTLIKGAVKLIHNANMTIRNDEILKDMIGHLAEFIELAAMEGE
jgi:hypothetical protein